MRKTPSFIFLCGLTIIIACDSNNGPSFSPTTPTNTSINLEPGQAQQASQAAAKANPLSSWSNCGNPNDQKPDDTALQNCLDRGGRIELEVGSPGYIVNGLNGDVTRGLWLSRSGTVFTSRGGMVKIIAGRDLYAGILQTPPRAHVDNFVIENVSFNGMVDDMSPDGPYRRRRDDCVDENAPGNIVLDGNAPGNIVLKGSGFRFVDNESINAMCGTGLGLLGSNYDVQHNYIAHNGRDKNSGAPGAPWADGMTVLSCERCYIAHNILMDNTDIDLVIGGGRGYVVELNTIAHFGKYAFAGLNIGNFNNNGDHSGSEVRGNTIYSGVADRLSMGILVGSHPWSTQVWVQNAGRVVGNTSYGNVVNLVVEGVKGGEVMGNNIYDSRGSNSGCGSFNTNYMVNPNHVTNTRLQEGWMAYQFDEWRCDSVG